jgi:hypothetical protein
MNPLPKPLTSDLGEVEVGQLVLARRGPPAVDGFYDRLAQESLQPA